MIQTSSWDDYKSTKPKRIWFEQQKVRVKTKKETLRAARQCRPKIWQWHAWSGSVVWQNLLRLPPNFVDNKNRRRNDLRSLSTKIWKHLTYIRKLKPNWGFVKKCKYVRKLVPELDQLIPKVAMILWVFLNQRSTPRHILKLQSQELTQKLNQKSKDERKQLKNKNPSDFDSN